jgi:hypothetical protein
MGRGSLGTGKSLSFGRPYRYQHFWRSHMYEISSGVSALLGAAIGSASGLAGAWIKERFESRRSLTKLAIDLASKDYEIKVKEHLDRNLDGEIAPIGAFYHYYNNLLQAIAENRCTPDFIRSNSLSHGQIELAFREAKREFEHRVSEDRRPEQQQSEAVRATELPHPDPAPPNHSYMDSPTNARG